MSELDPSEPTWPTTASVERNSVVPDSVVPDDEPCQVGPAERLVFEHSEETSIVPGEVYVTQQHAGLLDLSVDPSLGPWQYQYPQAPVLPQIFRHPNFADAGLFLVCLILGLLVTSGALGAALYFHWHGLRSAEEASKSTPVALITQLGIYLFALVVAIPFFRKVWGQGYFEGLHWHGATAFRRRYWLIITAVFCNGLAMVGNAILPFPTHAPIDQMFSTSRDAWMLAVFGVAIAPFFEEMIFRGFLLPAVATAWDWCGEKMTGQPPRSLDANGNPLWSAGAMIFASLMVSAPFAMMHATQVGKAWGPLVVLYSVSLALCAVRLVTRSLASSTLVHSTYNFMLFAIMFWQTDGFRHLDKM